MTQLTPDFIISPSILAADFTRLGDDINQVIKAGAQQIHFDVMDNNFVPNLSFGAPILASLRKSGIDCYIDVHLMTQDVDNLIDDFYKAGANSITIHYERDTNLTQELEKIKGLGLKAGLAIKPKTPAEVIVPYLHLVDMILVMTVEPGFGGQSFIHEMLVKITQVKQLIQQHQLTDPHLIEIQVDGGIALDTIGLTAAAGANNFVAGSAIFSQPDYSATIAAFKQQLNK